MPRKNHTQTTDKPIRDVPSAGFRCGSYLDGHNVHYIPALKLSADRAAVAARLKWDNDALHLTIDGDVVRVQNHNPAGVRLLLDELGTACLWYPSLRYACWPGATVRHWVSLALNDLPPCFSTERARIAEAELWA